MFLGKHFLITFSKYYLWFSLDFPFFIFRSSCYAVINLLFFFLCSENTKNILVECVASHLKHKKLTASYGARLTSSSGRILLQSVPSTKLYREKLVRALARELQVLPLVLDSNVLAPYVRFE